MGRGLQGQTGSGQRPPAPSLSFSLAVDHSQRLSVSGTYPPRPRVGARATPVTGEMIRTAPPWP
ncbi:hypothetical protein CCUS01_05120 [Colletotrichum cuscutae]|uniref:Uncharacterized protein n=1 Tax=Colletotrichum cuscutae TaxID=1209917 RepID=A0AAI9VDI7_9PEZI|nr:hypothetical protein CCUS01_05120 [Colletotrichum cuscutae]